MDDVTDFASPRRMMTNALYAVFFLVTMTLQTGVVASLPEPYRLFPLALVLGVIVLHERSLFLGTLWLAASGFVLEARGLGDGLAWAGLVAAAAAAALALSVFAKRSFWALLGIGGGTAVAYVSARLLWLLVWVAFTREQIHFGNLIEQSFILVGMAIFGVFVFGAYIRRFLRWSRDKFVSKGQLYDVSFPQ
jgi:hypothetical protein